MSSMNKFDRVEGIAVSLGAANIDTDQIVPARYLSRARQDGFGGQLFHDLRFHEDGSEKTDFVLNHSAYRGASILVADANFGCGSSREVAVWALMDYGIRVVIATSFGDIFYNNSFKNGLLAVVLPAEQTASLRSAPGQSASPRIVVDLPAQTITGADGQVFKFDIDPMRKQLLLEGMDEISLSLQHSAEMATFEATYDRDFPWLARQPASS